MSNSRGNFNEQPHNCQSCQKSVIRNCNLPCGHVLCKECGEKSDCNICQLDYINFSAFELTESSSVPNLSLTNERNNLNGFNLPNGEKPVVLEQLSHTRISPNLPREESKQFTFPSPPSISSPLERSPVLSGISNLFLEHSRSPSPSNYNDHSINPTTSMTLTLQNKSLESQPYISHSGSHYQREVTGYSNFDSHQGSLNDTSLTNLPTDSSEFPSRYVSNNHLQEQGIHNSCESDVNKFLEEEAVIKNCGHQKSEQKYFCVPCYQIFCSRCLKPHELHKYNHINDIIYNEDYDTHIINSFNEIKKKMEDAFQRTQLEKQKLLVDFERAQQQIILDAEILKGELSKREDAIKKDIDTIVASKLTGLEPQSSQQLSEEQENETCGIYLNSDSIKACEAMVENFGHVYGSACNENTVVSGIALSTIIVDHPCGFIVQCYDYLGSKCFNGGEDIRATLTDPNKMESDVKIFDLQNGYYQGVVSTQVEGQHRLRITLRGSLISGKEYILESKFYTELQSILRYRKYHHRVPQISNYFFRDMHCDNNGRLFITDTKSHCVHIFDHELIMLKSFGGPGEADGKFQNPHGITVDNEKRIIVGDSGNNRVQVFSYDGEFKFNFGSLGSEKSHFKSPEGVATDSVGNIAVADKENNRIQLFDKFGNFIEVTKGDSHFKSIELPYGLCFEEDDILLVSCVIAKSVAVVKFKLNRTSGQIYFEKDYESAYTPPCQIKKSPGFLVVKSKDNYICARLWMKKDQDRVVVGFYNTCTEQTSELSFNQQTPYSAAVSPEGYLYIIVNNDNNNSGFRSELHSYVGDSKNVNGL